MNVRPRVVLLMLLAVWLFFQLGPLQICYRRSFNEERTARVPVTHLDTADRGRSGGSLAKPGEVRIASFPFLWLRTHRGFPQVRERPEVDETPKADGRLPVATGKVTAAVEPPASPPSCPPRTRNATVEIRPAARPSAPEFTFKMCLFPFDHDRYISDVLYDNAVFEPIKVEIIRKLCTAEIAPFVFLDLGANIGYYFLHFLAGSKERHQVIGLEAMSSNVALLRASLDWNGFSNYRLVHAGGVASVTETPSITLCTDPNNQGHTNAGQASSPNCNTIPTTTLDQMLTLPDGTFQHPLLVKADLEGFEAAVLDSSKGAARFWEKPPAVLLFEWSPAWIARTGQDPIAFMERFFDLGYTVCNEDPAYPKYLRREDVAPLGKLLRQTGTYRDYIAIQCGSTGQARQLVGVLANECACS